ncbi:hypothetical protein ACTXOR_06370 [Arthrobacter rhombi]|uniref:hypothetical protein n=1 Tax=Arthrobacter rhombi TaxID=71253 RepID=UPI003FD45BAE
MSEEGIEDVVEGLLRQSMTAAAQLGEQLARARQKIMQKAEQRSEQQNIEVQRQIAADRAAMRAAVVPVSQDEWWKTAKPEQITQAHLLAEAWKDHDPEALAASEKISTEVTKRYGIDTDDLQGDGAYMQDMIAVKQMAEEQQRVAREHAEAMALVAAAQAEEIKRRASELHEQMEQYKVPEQYLANDDLVSALREAKEASGVADRAVAEQLHLIEKDGVEGPSIEELRKEVGEKYPGVDEANFGDAKFVAAARDWHEAKSLAEGSPENEGSADLQSRYQDAEKELFGRLAPMGEDIENKVMADQPAKASAAKAETAAEQPTGPAYGSKEHYEWLKNSLKGKASDTDVKARVAAAKGQAKHPNQAAKAPGQAPKARKANAGASMGREKSNDGPSR